MPDGAWIVSDVHLNPALPERMERFTAFLARWAEAGVPLYILGDLFDYWTGRRHAALPDYAPALAALARLHAEGAPPAYFIRGNRDFLIDSPRNAPPGLVPLGSRCLRTFGKHRTLLVHGDEFCVRDRPYQRLKLAIQNPTARALAQHLPQALTLWTAKRMREKSVRAIRRKPQPSMAPVPSALVRAFRSGADRIVFGHVHLKGIHTFLVEGRERKAFVLPDWCSGTPYLEFDGSDFVFRSQPEA